MNSKLLIFALLIATQYSKDTFATSIFERLKLLSNSIDTPSPAGHNSPLSNAKLSPVILLPGDGGSRLEAKLDRKEVLHKYCVRRADDWFDLWVNLSLLVPFAIDCWVEK